LVARAPKGGDRRGASNEVGGGFGEGGVRETAAFELGVDISGEVGGGEGFYFGGVGDAGFEVLVGAELAVEPATNGFR